MKPLLLELKICEEVASRVKAEYDRNLKELKAVSTTLRFPAMTSEFQKLLRARESQKVYEAHQKRAIKQMLDYKVTDKKSQTAFL